MAKPASGTSVDTSNPLSTNLIAAWGLLEGSGTSSADGTGNGHTLTLASSGYWTTIGGDPALAIGSATLTPVSVSGLININNGTTWSIAFRAKQTTAGNQGMVLGDNRSTSFDSFVWFRDATTIQVNSSAQLDVEFTISSSTTLADYVLTCDNSSPRNVKLYVNGSLNNTYTFTNNQFIINNLGNGYNSTGFSLIGQIGYVYVWSGRVLTSTEVTALYTNPYDIYTPVANPRKPASGTSVNTSNPISTNLTAAWGLLEGSGTSSADGTGNGHTLTLASSGYWSTVGGDPVLAIGSANITPLSVASAISITNGTAWSIAFRAKQTSTGNHGMIAGDSSAFATGDSFVWLNTSTSLRVGNNVGVYSDLVIASSTTLTSYVLTCDNSSPRNYKLYVDGSLSDSTTFTNSSFILNTLANGINDSNFSLIGQLDYVYLWTGRALTSTDVATLYSSPYEPYLSVPNPAARVSQVGLLTVEQGTPADRVSQVGMLAINEGVPGIRVSQTGIMAIYLNDTAFYWCDDDILWSKDS